MDKYQKLFLQEAKQQSERLQFLISQLKSELNKTSLIELYQILHKMKSISLILQFKKISYLAKSICENWVWTIRFSGTAEEQKKLFRKSMEASAHDFQLLFAEINLVEITAADPEALIPAPLMTMRQFGHLLIVDDDEASRKAIFQEFTSEGYLVEETMSIGAARQMLYETAFDLVVVNLSMEPESGFVLFEFLKSDANFKWIPLIVLSEKEDMDEKVRCLDLGADDYIVKPVLFKYLLARTRRLLTRVREFEQMAFHDALTDVYNRRYFENHLSISLHRIQRTLEPMSIALLDIDRFKTINDTYGHPVGDQVLREIARILRENLRVSDLIARFGGEEFVLVFEKTTEKIASLMMEVLLQKVREHCMATVNEQPIYVTFSGGIAAWEKGMSKDEWIERADQLLYYAKESGRDRCMTLLDMERG